MNHVTQTANRYSLLNLALIALKIIRQPKVDPQPGSQSPFLQNCKTATLQLCSPHHYFPPLTSAIQLLSSSAVIHYFYA